MLKRFRQLQFLTNAWCRAGLEQKVNCSSIKRITPWASRPPSGPPGQRTASRHRSFTRETSLEGRHAVFVFVPQQRTVQVLPFDAAQGRRRGQDDSVRRSIKGS